MIAVSLFNFNLHKKKKDLNERLVHLYNFALDIKKRHFNDKKGKYFLFYGRLSEEKGLRTLLKAFKTLANDYELLIAGDGLLKEEMLKEIEEHQLNIKYLGFKHGSELEGIIENSSFVIVPSEWYENNPLTIIEAYSFGKPVIGANIGGIPELIQNNTTGFLFESRDVTELRDKIELANKISDNEYKMMSENARAFAIENFNEDIHYEQLMSIYKSVL